MLLQESAAFVVIDQERSELLIDRSNGTPREYKTSVSLGMDQSDSSALQERMFSKSLRPPGMDRKNMN
jgi:hypothetical protein